MDKEYKQLLLQVKSQISNAQVKAVSASNTQMLLLYWKLGHLILFNQSKKGWGAKVIDLLSNDLKKELPHLKGFSVRNLKYMRKFALEYPFFSLERIVRVGEQLMIIGENQSNIQNLLSEFAQQPVAQIDFNQNTSSEIVQLY